MSSTSSDEGDMTIIKSKVTVSQTEVTASKKDLDDVIFSDISKVGKGALKSLSGFRAFILRGNVVDLAIGIVIGAAFTTLVNALVKDLITPLIPVQNTNLSNWSPTIPHTAITFHVGDFINAIISFLIVAAILYYLVVQPVNRLVSLYKPKESEAKDTRECPYCFQAVNIKATRCPFCTSPLAAENGNGHHKEVDPVLILPASLEKLSEQLAEQILRKATAQLEKTAAAAEAGSGEKE